MRDIKSTLPIRGTICALVTPFKNGDLDRISLMSLVEWQILHGVDALAPCSLAGEAPTLTLSERAQVIGICVEISEGKVPVIAGTGSNCTQKSIALTSQAKACGADVALVSVPYYNKPTQEGVIRHFETIARAVDIPIMIYHSPLHQAIDLLPSTIIRLAAIPSVIGIVDSTGDLSRLALYRKISGSFIALSGDDKTAPAFSLAGGYGALSSVANVLPHQTSALFHAALGGNIQTALTLSDRLQPVITALASNENPATLKSALNVVFGLSPQVRLPMVQPDTEMQETIKAALEKLVQSEADAHIASTIPLRARAS
jgi:4-hydroxy-tetrahydrodipicolinate synthase